MTKDKAKPNRLAMEQLYPLIKYFEENQGVYRGHNVNDVAKLVSDKMGFVVSPATVLSIQRKLNINICATTKKVKAIDPNFRVLAKFVCKMAKDLDIDVPQEVEILCL